MDDIAELTVRKSQNLDVTLVGQGLFNVTNAGLKSLLPIHKTTISRKLATFKTFIKEKIPEVRSSLGLGPGPDRQVSAKKV